MDFEMKVEHLPDAICIVSLAGEVDLYVAPEFKQQLLDVLNQGLSALTVDLSEVSFINSTTLGVLVGSSMRLRERAGDLGLVCSEPAVIRIFEITGLDRTFDLHATREDALAALRVLNQAA
jgi:anti-sigma B factor antagonist